MPAQPKVLTIGPATIPTVADEFNIFRGTEALLLKQRFVLMAMCIRI